MKKFVETLKQTGRAIRAMNLPNKLTLLREVGGQAVLGRQT